MMHDKDMKEGQERWEKGNKLQVRKKEEHGVERWRYLNNVAQKLDTGGHTNLGRWRHSRQRGGVQVSGEKTSALAEEGVVLHAEG